MKLIFELDNIKIWGEEICLQPGEPMRAAEQRTAAEMVRSIFGPDFAIDHNTDGAPEVHGTGAEISVSHGAGMVIIAVAPEGHHIGVDIEAPRPQLQRVARRFVSADDSASLSLLQLWAGKEAAFKAAGISGLYISDIPITGSGSSAVAHLPDGRLLSVHYHDMPERSLIALAEGGDGSPVGSKP